MTSRVPALIVHGGAGADPTEEPEELREGVVGAVEAGWQILGRGGRALDAVEAAVRVLEDHPRFNAGRGSVLTTAGTVEMDASIMDEGGRGHGGLILVDWKGRLAWAHSTPFMPVGLRSAGHDRAVLPF